MFTDKEIQLIKFLLDYHLRCDVDFNLSADTRNTAHTALKKVLYYIKNSK